MPIIEIRNVIMKQCIHWAKLPYSALNVTTLRSPLIYAVIAGFIIIENIKV
jgi:hypothetical protein